MNEARHPSQLQALSPITLMIVFVSTGCQSGVTRYRGIQPVSPCANILPSNVHSLQPTLRWKCVSDQHATYDLIVYPFVATNRSVPCDKDGRAAANAAAWRVHRTDGVDPESKRIYYRQGLEKNDHTLEQTLEPDVQYAWSIRPRFGNKVGHWATFDGFMQENIDINPLQTIGEVTISPMLLFGGAYARSPEAVYASGRPYRRLLGTDLENKQFSQVPFRFITPRP